MKVTAVTTRKNPRFRLMEGEKSKTSRCTCAKFHPKYRMPGADHVATTNFEILDDPVLAEVFGMGPSMRFRECENWVEDMVDYVTKKLTDFRRELINNGIDRREAEKLIQEIATQVSNIFEEAEEEGDEDAKEMPDLNKRPHYTWIDGRNPCAPLVVTPLDKFGDRFGLVCKRLYDHLMFEWLEGPSYQKETNMSEKEIVRNLNTYAVTHKLADFGFHSVVPINSDPRSKEGTTRTD